MTARKHPTQASELDEQPRPTGLVQLGERLTALKRRIDAAEEQLKALKSEKSTLETEILSQLRGSGGMTQFATNDTVYFKSTRTTAKVIDRGAWFNWIHKKRAYHLLTTHVSSAACQEEVQTLRSKSIPGLEIIELETLGTRSK